ncbi:MAG TPA: SUMF1/EgtB/PvdO family nonheme iron enzyme [Chthoniobacteraceae bacterium]|nr:SUMF1/EgtB/PvdO family nonheme iron enzyme [Chthoniobacteraceae bacterium]
MKTLIPCLAAFLLAGSLSAQTKDTDQKTSAPAPALQLVIDLTDGSRTIGAPAVDKLKLKTAYAELEFDLSKAQGIEFGADDHAAHIKLQNGDMLNGNLDIKEIALKTDAGPVTVPLEKIAKIEVRAGSMGGDFVNSLGMEFVKVPGTKVLFGIWDTRVQDYRAYSEANPKADGKWKNPGFKQKDDEPVVNITWSEAKAFCTWLTQKERQEGKITQDQEYRLPTDKEWSIAAGKQKFPWGDTWPPPKNTANYDPSFNVDDFPKTSPVGSFKPNAFGLYDMGGNVWQWCEDWFQSDMGLDAVAVGLSWFGDDGGGKKYRVARGGSWSDKADPVFFTCAFRDRGEPERHRNNCGFRCVLAPVSEPAPAPAK